MALPLKSGADLYTQEIRRVALQNEGSDLAEYITGSIYFNTNSASSNSSNRIRYRGLSAWHSVANIEDIEDLQNQIDSIDFASSEEFTSLKERVDAFLDGDVDSDAVLDNLKEIQAFLDTYDGATSLVDLLATKADKATTLAGYGITDGVKYYGGYSVDNALYGIGYDNASQGSIDLPVAGGGFIAATQGSYGIQIIGGYSTSGHLFWRRVSNNTLGAWCKVLDESNYASVLGTVYAPYNSAGYLPLSGGTLSKNLETLRLHSPEETGGSTYIGFSTSSNNTIQGYIGYSSSGFMFIQRGVGGASGTQVVGLDNTGLFAWEDNASKYFLHSGNFNSYAPTLTGTGASGTWGINISGGAAKLTNNYVTNLDNAPVDAMFSSGFQASNIPATNYATGLTLYNPEAGYYFQLAYDTSGLMYSRVLPYQGSWGSWKTIAFTDSIVAGANKLVTASGTEVALAENGGVVFPYVTSTLIDGLDSVGLHVKRNMTANPAASGGLAMTNCENKGTILFGGTSGLFVYNYVNDAYSTVFRINNYGNVTIGTSDLASSTYKLYVNGLTNITSRLLVGGATDDSAYALNVNGTAWFYTSKSYAHLTADGVGLYNGLFYGGYTASDAVLAASSIVLRGNVIIKSDNTLKVGDATISWDSTNSVLKVDKDFASDGQVSSGGIADEAASGGSGLEKVVFTLEAGQTTYECAHNLATREVTVCIYEEGDDYQQILTDVYLDDANTARIVFGSATDVAHKVVIVG